MIVIDEVRPGQTQYAVTSITDDQIVVLVRDELISPAVEASLKQILAQKATIARLDTEIQTKQREIQSIGSDQDRVRENMKSLKGSAEEKQLLQRYVKQLQDQEDRLETLRREVQSVTDDRQKAQAELTRMIEALVG
jgi:septal ring factor EnvC (AmiA/AmiB activator)